MNRYVLALLAAAVGALLATAVLRGADGDREGQSISVSCKGAACAALGIPCPVEECAIEAGDGTRAVYARAADGEGWEVITGLLVLDDGTVHDGRADVEALKRFSETGELPAQH
jgi:hypothetical protein